MNTLASVSFAQAGDHPFFVPVSLPGTSVVWAPVGAAATDLVRGSRWDLAVYVPATQDQHSGEQSAEGGKPCGSPKPLTKPDSHAQPVQP